MKKVEKYYKHFFKELGKYKPGIHMLNAGCAEETVRRFEDTYNINLPYYYREWLKINNGGELFKMMRGTVLAGIRDVTMKNGRLELADNFDVTKRTPDMPDYLLFLARTGEGDLIGYDLNHTDSMDGEVIYWDSEEKKVTTRWKNFPEWLEDELAYWMDMVDYNGNKKD